jgi:hypothetical protein
MVHKIQVNEKEWFMEDIQKTIAKWRTDCVKIEEEAKVTEQLRGLKFKITGSVPVSPPNQKAYLMYMISMTNEDEKDKAPDVILKKFDDFLNLHRRLSQIYGESSLRKFPPKKMTGSKGAEEREFQLTDYLNGFSNLRDFEKVPEIRQFITTSGNVDPAKAAMNKSMQRASSVAGSLSSDVFMEGFLTKKGHKRRNWKRRFFVLHEGEINYYVKKGANDPKGTIYVNEPGTSVIFMENSAASKFRFMIITSNQIFPLYADNETDRRDWMASIDKVIKQVNNDTFDEDEYEDSSNLSYIY